jgi:AcrR family transcriptional regulator
MTSQVNSADSTAAKLLAAAMAEFNDHGFAGTDTNRIARRAGFAPQTFYRWYKDKTEIFIAAYRVWWDAEREALQALVANDAPSLDLIDAGVAHHRRHLKFRRSLNQLSVENPDIRRARAEARVSQIAQIRAWAAPAGVSDEEIAVRLFQFERLADAIAEGEFEAQGLTDAAARAEVARLIDGLRGLEV